MSHDVVYHELCGKIKTKLAKLNELIGLAYETSGVPAEHRFSRYMELCSFCGTDSCHQYTLISCTVR